MVSWPNLVGIPLAVFDKDIASLRNLAPLAIAHASPSMRVRHDYTGVDREGFAPDDPFFHAARHHGLEQLAQKIAIAKTAVPVLGKRRMIGDVSVEPQSTEME